MELFMIVLVLVVWGSGFIYNAKQVKNSRQKYDKQHQELVTRTKSFIRNDKEEGSR